MNLWDDGYIVVAENRAGETSPVNWDMSKKLYTVFPPVNDFTFCVMFGLKFTLRKEVDPVSRMKLGLVV